MRLTSLSMIKMTDELNFAVGIGACIVALFIFVAIVLVVAFSHKMNKLQKQSKQKNDN